MALHKKYAGLPDLDAAPEVYETPDLADDVSTVPTGTVRTVSPSPSSDEDGRPGLDRQPIDRDGARRRFETSKVDARDVDFSDSIGGTRRAYRTRSARRRRRGLQGNGGEIIGDVSESDDETLPMRLARLKREAEEVRLELERREREEDEDEEFKDSQEQPQELKRRGQDDEDIDMDGVQELSRILDGLSTKVRLKPTGSSVEDDLISRLNFNSRQRQTQGHEEEKGAAAVQEAGSHTTLSAVADFSDRLTALESSLGISSTSAVSETSAILPTLANLSSQITTLTATLSPPPTSTSSQSNTTHLDTASTKLKQLIVESDRLTQSRKAALDSLTELHEKRMQQLVSTASVHGNTRPSRLRGLSNTDDGPNGVVDSSHEPNANGTGGPGDESLQIQSQLFLDEQASKITALYHLLPTIQDMQPLLPVVLERLRTLSVLHTGAAQAKGLVDDLEGRQREMKEEIRQWREAVEDLETGMKEAEWVMKSNVDVLGGRVNEVEKSVERVGSLR